MTVEESEYCPGDGRPGPLVSGPRELQAVQREENSALWREDGEREGHVEPLVPDDCLEEVPGELGMRGVGSLGE